jgi:hypothetical protein
LLRFCQAGMFRARWSDDILEEWTSNLLKLKPQLADSMRIPMKPAMHSNTKPATHSNLKPASVPI